jgi:hypothetical protein
MAKNVLVSIARALVNVSPFVAWNLEYDVHNLGQKAIWLVIDESLVFRHDATHIELSYARGKMQPGVDVFGYFDPKVVKIAPGGSLRQSIEVTWPCILSDIWNAERVATPPPGEYEVSVRIGYASTATPRPPRVGESVETPVLRWQKEAVSPPVQIVIPPYTASH